jgi:hypothetical protein
MLREIPVETRKPIETGRDMGGGENSPLLTSPALWRTNGKGRASSRRRGFFGRPATDHGAGGGNRSGWYIMRARAKR